MSTRCTTPHASAAGSTRCATLWVPNVTVTSARTCGPSRRPVSTSTPDGTSTATTGVPANLATTRSASGRRPGRPPIPTIPSSTTSGGAASSAATTRPPAARSAATPSSWALSESSTASTPAPRRASSAPAYSASPPLSPAPTSSSTRAPYTPPSRSATATASPDAARCISVPSGTRAIRSASAARTCSTVCACLTPRTLSRRPVGDVRPKSAERAETYAPGAPSGHRRRATSTDRRARPRRTSRPLGAISSYLRDRSTRSRRTSPTGRRVRTRGRRSRRRCRRRGRGRGGRPGRRAPWRGPRPCRRG